MKGIIWAAIPIGFCMGLGIYTFYYGKGYSYLKDDPAVCMNCHIMREQFDGWVKSTHHGSATCNDCHTPQNLAGKYSTKALNGFWHSFYFTTGNFQEPIQMKARNKKIVESNCRRCHEQLVSAMDSGHTGSGKVSCVHCHTSVGH